MSIAVVSVAWLLSAGPAAAATITFDEAAFTSLMKNTYQGTTGLLVYSDPFARFSLPEVTLTAGGETSGGFNSLFVFRSTFDNRPTGTYPYQHISGNLAQVSGTELTLTFAAPISMFGFGAALNATASPGLMDVELFLEGAQVGVHSLGLVRSGGSSNSEGGLMLAGIFADSVRLSNRGDGQNVASNFNWVIDNIKYETAPTAVPAPTALPLFALGGAALGCRCCAKLR